MNAVMQSPTNRLSPRGSPAREATIWELLVWAFRDECASLDFDPLSRIAGERPGVGMEYLLMQRHNLGCQIDGGGRSEPHPDADSIADALCRLPEGCGGARMACWIAECARADRLPVMNLNPVARCEPTEWRRSKHGMFAVSEYWRDCPSNARLTDAQVRQRWGFACRVRFSGTAQEVARLRRQWLQFRLALLELRTTFQVHGLSSFVVTNGLPPETPWEKP